MQEDALISQQLKPGCLIKRRLSGLAGLAYGHVGVYVGDGRVIHFNGAPSGQAEALIEDTTLTGFARGQAVKVIATPRDAIEADAILREARRLLASPKSWDGRYDFLRRNCEDFARQCYRAESFRDEALPGSPLPWSQRSRSIAATAGATLLTVAGLVLGRRLRGRRDTA